MLIFEVVTLTVAGLLVGNELAVALFVHPTLTSLPDAVHSTAATALASVLGRVMPFWYALATILTAGCAWVLWRRTGVWPMPIVISAGLWVLSIVYTVSALVPINNKVASWTEQTRPAGWKSIRSTWDKLHVWRVLLLSLAFVFLADGLVRGA